MYLSIPLVRKNYVIFAFIVMLMVTGILSWVFTVRQVSFQQHQYENVREALAGVRSQVSFYVIEKRRMVKLFVHENIKLVSAFAADPANEGLRQRIEKQLRLYFPDHFSFTIADANGKPLFEDFDGLVSNLCLGDIREFSKAQNDYHPYIHPNSEGYHFDVMVRYGKGENRGVFFVSFLADLLGDIIKSIQGPYQTIMLIEPDRDDLIEVIAEGARNCIVRDDYRLTKDEIALINLRLDVAGTRWQVAAFRNEELENSFVRKLSLQLCTIFIIFMAVVILFVVRIRHEEQQRERGEQQRRALMGVVSHEFRSPTSIIKSSLETIENGTLGEVDSDVKEFVDIALKNTTRLSLLVDDFLDMENIESGNLKLNLQKTQLSMLVSHVVSNSKLYAEQFGSSFRVQEPLLEEYVYCDENRIDQVLVNLLTNAAKYGDENGVIDISMMCRDKWLRVSISNLGPGIPSEFQDRVFEKFAMAYAPKKQQNVKSSGLGLSIAKEIIERHGGHIGFESEPGNKTIFWFELEIVSPDGDL